MEIIHSVNPNELIKRLAQELQNKAECKPPVWAKFVKTGTHKERPPMDENWWYQRLAAILRTVYIQGPVGVNTLRTKYGGRKNMGYQPERFKKGSGNIARKSLQQLEKAGLIKHVQKGLYKGRVVTPAGMKLLELVATQISTEAKKTQ